MPHTSPERESRRRRLLRLMLLQIAILSIANGCSGGHHHALEPAQPAPRHRYVEARFMPTDLTESLDKMADRGTDPRKAIFPLSLTSRTHGEAFVEHTATSRLDSGRLVVETAP